MKRTVKWIAMALGVALVAAIVAGCGSDNNDSSGSGTSSSNAQASGGGGYGATTTASNGNATVSAAKTSIGTILVGTNGRTLYMFEKDKSPMSTCSGACAAAWPPLTTAGSTNAGSGVKSAKLTTSKRPDGTQQVVYAGHPLYYYAGDTKPGQTKGQDLDQFGAEWYTLSPSGSKWEGGEES
jgi:predicted lipoprotein with Yx(FWY)xxD motif